MSLVFAFLAFFGWGVGDIFGTISTRKIGAYSTTIWFVAFQFLIFIVLAPFFLADLKGLTLSLLVINLALGLVSVVASTTFYEAMGAGNAPLAGTIVSSFAALTVILSIIFFHERLTPGQIIAILTIFLGIIISTLDLKTFKQHRLLNSRLTFYALVSMVSWGIYWAFLKIPVAQIGWYWPIVFSQITYPILLIVMKIRKIKLVRPTRSIFPFLFLNSLILGIGSFSYNLGIQRGLVAVVAPISGAYSVLFAILAYFVFRDPLTKRERGGIAITLLGIVLLSFFST